MTASMPTLKGSQTSSPPLVSTAKRKRTDSSTLSNLVNGSHSANTANTPPQSQEPSPHETIRNIYRIVESHDTSPSILQYLKSINTLPNGDDDDAPSPKRQKLSTPSHSIGTKVKNETYATLQEFVSDVDGACLDLLSDAKAKSKGATQWSYVPDALDRDRLIAQTTAFRKLVYSLVHRCSALKTPSRPVVDVNEKKGIDGNKMAVGVTVTGDSSATDPSQPSSRAVLTLFGNAQGHKQLFSSFQHPSSKLASKSHRQDNSGTLDGSIEPIMPLRENGLPNGISSTRIIPVLPEDGQPQSKSGTFLELFPPPSSLPPLNPPKTPKPPTTQQSQSSIIWAESKGPPPPVRSLGYTYQRLSTGHWLGYDGVAIDQEPSTPELQRKRRSRALSTGEAITMPSVAAMAVQSQAREEALFRSAYSSFAPCRDNSAAVISEDVKNQLWWQKAGAQCFERTFGIDPALDSQDGDNVPFAEASIYEEEALFKRAVDLFEPETSHNKTTSDAAIVDDEEGMAPLKEVSHLLETLYSQQRIRNSCLNTIARSSVGQNPPLQDLMGSPSNPSAAEVATYKSLKAQLASAVATLPPYAVAKLDGEQLEELNISQRVPLEERSFRGVMDEDPASRAAKAAAYSAAVGTAAAQTRQSTAMTPGALQYPQARTAQMAGSSRHGQQYYNAAPSSLPRQSSTFSRQPLSAWQTPTQAYNTSSAQPRQSYANSQSYNVQQLTRQINSTIRAQLPPYPTPRTNSTGQQSNGTYQTTPAQPAYQQRAQMYANSANYGTKSPYNAQQTQTPNATYNLSQQQQSQAQFPRPSHQLSQQPSQSLSPASTMKQLGLVSNGSRPQTPAKHGQMSMGVNGRPQQSQSPAPAPAAVMGSGTSETPQPQG